ncbi:hypothetical protein Tco_0798355 [Tanacetum coccineum]
MKLPRPRTALPVSSDLVGQELALLVPNGFEKVYYCKSGAKLTSIRELKSDKDIVDMLKVGYDNGFQIDNAESDSSDDDYHYSDDDLEEIENVDFHTEGDDNVVIKNLATQDPFLTKGVVYPAFDPDIPWDKMEPILGMRYETPHQLKMALANYGVAHGKKGNKHRVLPRKVRTRLFRGDEGNQASRTLAMNKLAFSLEDTITPSIRKRLEILKEKQREWVVYPSGFQELEVRKGDQSYGVSLQHKCASRGGGRSGRGDGNDGSGSGVNDASGSGVNAGMFIPSYTMLKVKQYILLESMLFWLEYQLDFIFYMNKHLGNLWKNKAKRQLNSAEQESWDKERREERNRKKE